MSEQLVSVIIPVRDAAPYIGEAIASVLAQSHRPIEVIVVDDGSSDGSADMARAAWADVQVISQPATGIGASRNRGAEAASGAVIGFLDADDLWIEEKLELQLQLLDAGADLVGGKVRNFVSPDLSAEEAKQIVLIEGDHDAPVAGTVIITREGWERVGPFSETLRGAEMLDWTLRYRRAGLEVAHVEGVVMLRRLHATNTTRMEPDRLLDYTKVIKQELDRRRAAS